METYDVVVLGGGPAGLAAALEAHNSGAKTIIIERESSPGGILKQCIHDGFGVIRFKQKLSGPEYAYRYIKMVINANIPIFTSTFVTKVEKNKGYYDFVLSNSNKGIYNIQSKALILANGCRERTCKQIFIHGTRPAGIYTAGTAQYLVNILGYLPCKKCVILGSGDIGLIMARRLTLEGSKVLGVYEAKPTPSGLSRNIAQCLEDYSIPLYLSHTVTRVFGDDRLEAVEITKLDENMKPIRGTEKIIECDGLILSVGLIPENEIAESLGVKICANTKGPYIDQNFMTNVEGVFSCGNALHVNDLVDYVSESGKYAGKNAAYYVKQKEQRELASINASSEEFLYIVPQYINIKSKNNKIVLYLRSRDIKKNVWVQVKCSNSVLADKKFLSLKPPEMKRVELDLAKSQIQNPKDISINILEG